MPLSKRNRRGIFWLLIFGLLIAYTPRILSTVFAVDAPQISHEELIAVHEEFVEAEKERKTNSLLKDAPRYNAPPEQFDPNTYGLQDWMNLGMSEKQAEVVLKFSERGLRSNDDLQRIFVFPGELFELVRDSTFYPEQKKIEKESPQKQQTIELIDINTASMTELETLPGIGPFYAKLIVEHREKLGGFLEKGQLLEMYKFDDERMAQIDSYIFVSSVSPVQLNINKATLEELRNHPYIDYYVANSIVKMRSHEEFKMVSDIKRSKLIDEELFVKLKPYLTAQ